MNNLNLFLFFKSEHSNELVSTSDIFNAAKSSLSGNEWRSSVFDYALEHCPSIPKAASDDWVAAIPKVQKQVSLNIIWLIRFYR